MKPRRLSRPLGALFLLLGSCAAPDPVFTAASRDAYNAITPEYQRYVQADPALTAEQKQRRQATCDRWNEAITAREKGGR